MCVSYSYESINHIVKRGQNKTSFPKSQDKMKVFKNWDQTDPKNCQTLRLNADSSYKFMTQRAGTV